MVKTKETKESSSVAGAEEATGTTQLPLSRIKKLIAIDPELAACSNPGAFLIAQATEMFIQHLADSAHTVMRSERKPRKVIQYKDLAAAVARDENFEFLSDVVPKTVPYKEAKAMKGRKQNGANVEEKGGRQAKLGKTFEVVIEQKNGDQLAAQNGNGRQQSEQSSGEDADPDKQLQEESRTSRLSLTSENGILNGGEDRDGDVQMR